MTSIDTLREALPEYAKDLRLNLSSILNSDELTPVQLWGSCVACAAATGNSALLEATKKDALEHISSAVIDAALGVAAVMAMNNIYYRFLHLSGRESLLSHPSKLRMNALRSASAEKTDTELWSLAVSAINGCGMCIEAHLKQLRESGVTDEAVLAAVRIASVFAATAVTLRSSGASVL